METRADESMYQGQFFHWFLAYRRHNLAACLDIIKRIDPLYIVDWPHLAQNVRAGILKHIPVLRFQGRQFNVLQEAMNDILQLAPVFTDLTSSRKMSDGYCITLFQIKHVITLFYHRLCSEVI
jgi:hypothetical protein